MKSKSHPEGCEVCLLEAQELALCMLSVWSRGKVTISLILFQHLDVFLSTHFYTTPSLALTFCAELAAICCHSLPDLGLSCKCHPPVSSLFSLISRLFPRSTPQRRTLFPGVVK